MFHRRSFLRLAAGGGALGLGGCAGSFGPAASVAAPSPRPGVDLEECSISELAERLARGELTAEALVGQYLARVAALDHAGPGLRAVLEVNPDALAIARALDEERRAQGPRSALHGIPVLIKDNIDTSDRMQTTAGSLALVGTRPSADAHVVTLLRRAGAVVLGKTNLSEWANIRSAQSTSGWSARGGLTRNPYALDRNPSGSSSGSAVAVAASLCAAALGTETDGSIVSPASICGIVGLKPTVGLLSRSGIVPISHTQDTPGPMTRTVADAALLLGVLASQDPRDPATAAAAGRIDSDYAKGLDPNGLRGRRVGVVRNFKAIAPTALPVLEAAVAVMGRLGAVIVDPVELRHLSDFDDPEMDVLLTELKADMAQYLAARNAPPHLRTLADVAKFNAERAREEMPWFGQDLFEQALAKGGLDAPAYRDALARCQRMARDEGIDAALRDHGLDALVALTGGPAWTTDLVNGDNFTGSSSTPAAVAGYPSITVPAGEVHGLPIGISFFAGAFSEAILLRLAFAFEQATKARRKPALAPTIAGGA